MKIARLTHKFVETIPERLDPGVLYVCIQYATAAHLCCCGCGREVVTPITPTDWSIIFDGESISLHPSVGNWGFECQSHYWITRGEVQWEGRWSQAKIAAGKARDTKAKIEYFNKRGAGQDVAGSGGDDISTEAWLQFRKPRP